MRINRNNEHDAKVYLALNDIYVLDELMKMFTNASLSSLVLDKILYPDSKNDIYKAKREKESLKYQFIDLLEDMPHGSYKKTYFVEKLKCSKNSFSSAVLKQIEVIEYCMNNNVEIRNHYIVKHEPQSEFKIA